MKKQFFILSLALLLLLSGCGGAEPVESTPPATEDLPPVNILIAEPGWNLIDGQHYHFGPDGHPTTGWLIDEGQRYYLDARGLARTGWQDIDGKRFCFREDGTMITGWLEEGGKTYFFGMDGSMITGHLNIAGQVFYFGEDGARHTGWLELEEGTYYFDAEGVMAVGPTEIDGVLHYFSPHGIEILLVNPWNKVPEGYTVELVNVTDRDRLETRTAQALQEMLADCIAAGFQPYIVSAYRTHDEQQYLYNRKVNYYLDLDYSRKAAEEKAALSVAIPDTSEHQLGFAVDIIDINNPNLDDSQEKAPTQQWLMQHCHEYGFILRYPVGTTDITGIIYEPWHYRYVGVEIAREITNLGITLEEYLGAVKPE